MDENLGTQPTLMPTLAQSDSEVSGAQTRAFWPLQQEGVHGFSNCMGEDCVLLMFDGQQVTHEVLWGESEVGGDWGV